MVWNNNRNKSYYTRVCTREDFAITVAKEKGEIALPCKLSLFSLTSFDVSLTEFTRCFRGY